MKKIINRLLVLVGAITLLSSCEKEEIRAILNPAATPAVTLSTPTLVLSKDNANNEVLTISWAKPDYGFDAGALYTILLDKKGGDFSKAVAFATGSELKKTFKASELNSILLGLGLVAGTAADLDLKVQAKLGEATVLTSPLATLKATPYLDRLDLSSPWGVVGSAAANGWNGPDMPFYKTATANVYVAYVTLATGEMKIRKNNDWAVNYGDDGANGTLEANGANIAVKAGTYRITFNESTLAYKVEKFYWGLVGSATPNGWNGPDQKMVYDPFTDQWRAIVKLLDGELKIRQADDWGTNYGDDGANNTLDLNGANIVVKKGTYLVTFNANDLKYTIEKIDVWGIVGSATAGGWNGPDAKFFPDFSKEKVWKLSGIKLTDGEIKFRLNDDWAVNYGDDGANGTLEAGGANIVVKAGTYDIVLDFSNASSPTYKMTKR